MSTFVLVHDAWQGAWSWDRLAALLREGGHTVLAPDLPGYGSDRTPFSGITLQTHVEAVQHMFLSCKEPAIVVGHGMAGVAISAVAAASPGQIQCVTYLAAYIPKSGQSAIELSRGDVDARTDLFVAPSKDECGLVLAAQGATEVLYGDCDAGTAKWALMKLRPAPRRPAVEVVSYDERVFEGVAKFFIECTRDRAVSIARQRQMRRPFKFQGVFTLESDHSPMISHVAELAEILILLSQISRKRSSGKGNVPV